MRKRVAGGVVLVAIGIGIWLSNLFTGLGTGGAGTNVGMSPDVAVSLKTSDTTPAGGTMETSVEATDGVGITERPVVLIDEQHYYLEQRDGEEIEYQPATLSQIVELARSAEPDGDGIRIQIKRRGSSRPSAETSLDTALANAGITNEQIQRHAGFIE